MTRLAENPDGPNDSRLSVREHSVLEAVRAGDESVFAGLVERHRHELEVHCYRMLGSIADAEDLVQETFLRAWRARETFQGRSSARAWLYRVATNACLDATSKRPLRVLPFDVGPAVDPHGQARPATGVSWLEPYPDELLERVASGDDEPDAVLIDRETIELAFIAAIQYLPAKQRAVLIMRDVLSLPASDVAESLGDTVAAVKSALQRARATLRQLLPPRRVEWAPMSEFGEQERIVLERYMQALEHDDPSRLAAVLREDLRAAWTPMGIWTDGRENFITGTHLHAPPGEFRALPTRANRQPAVAIYLRAPGEERFCLLALQVLRIEAGAIAEIIDYSTPELLARFAVPASL